MVPESTPRTTPRWFGRGTLLLVASLVAWSAHADCPEGCVSFGSGGTACGTATASDSLSIQPHATGQNVYHAAYDAALGTLELSLLVDSSIDHLSSAAASLTDEFRVLGIPAGTPLTFQAHVSASGAGANFYRSQHRYAFGSTVLGLRDSAGNEDRQTFSSGGRSGDVMLVIHAVAGEPFTLTLFAQSSLRCADTGWDTNARGTLYFADLPVGARVESCGGYFNDTPTASRGIRWGQLKSRYRSTDR